MADIYEAWHYMIGADGVPDKNVKEQRAKWLGEYTTRAKAEAAIERRRVEEGFRNWPHGFRIKAVPVDVGMSPAGSALPKRIYSAWHFCIDGSEQANIDDPSQTPTELGRFVSDEDANAIITRLRVDLRFIDFPDGFCVFCDHLDIDHWTGGFNGWSEVGDTKYDDRICLFRMEAAYDYVGLWQIVRDVELLIPNATAAVIEAETLFVVARMLSSVFIAGYLAENGGFNPWPDQEASAVLDRIKSEQQALGTDMASWSVWFTVPKG